MSKTYEGKSNYETWNVALWIANTEHVYYWLTKIRDLHGEMNTVEDVERWVKTYYPFGTPDFDSAEDYKKVDWNEIKEVVDEM